MKNAILLSLLIPLFSLNLEAGPKTYVDFDLINPTEESIPLVIPNVMNPNLSPDSRSGVRLKVGQEILFRYKGKKRVLLVVTEELEGKRLDVSQLLKERKEQLVKEKAEK